MKKHLKLFIEGIVQGVGFRPHVYNMAKSFGLKGYVLNDSRGVTIEAEASQKQLEDFKSTLKQNPPPLSLIRNFTENYSDILCNYKNFFIKKSEDTGEKTVLISPDIATCKDCLREMTDQNDNRYNYAFINCTNCGPRFTIITDVPYDRPKTSMSAFPMCDFCRGEYEDPQNRRFHAQPVACPKCGPQVRLYNNNGKITEENPDKSIKLASSLLKQGKIIAIKGLGGYHLAVDSKNKNSVKELRKRKYREDKPFAVMFPDVEQVKEECFLNPEEEKLLTSHNAPIVLLKKKIDTKIAPSTAPNNNYLGVMLPYTPLHHLIMSGFKNPLVMTSGNVSEEPISYENNEAFSRLGNIADFFLIHNRPIHTRCDDTVMRVFRGKSYPLRRSRGYVPYPVIIKKPAEAPILAVGGELKNTFCLLRKNQAFISHHIGDLENMETLNSFEEGIAHFKKLFDIKPEVIAYDAHPRYLSTQFALNSDIEKKVPVQHHHAHIVSCMADNGISGDVIGIALDGVGYGLDGKLWGCEFMAASERNFDRLIRLKYVKLAGGEKAIREPWRIAFAYLNDLPGDYLYNLNFKFLKDIGENKINFIKRMLEKNIGSPEISSAGRLFDAVSAMIGIRSFCNFEGQAAIEMEMISDGNEKGEYPVVIDKIPGKENPGYYNAMSNYETPYVINPDNIFQGIIDDISQNIPVPIIAGKFHNTMARIVLEGAKIISGETGLKRVVLSGGVFQNILLLEKSLNLLESEGFKTFIHNKVPTNDGGISLGQAVIANLSKK